MEKHKQPIKILYVKSPKTNSDQILYSLKKFNSDFNIIVTDLKAEFKKALKIFEPEIIISEYNIPSFHKIASQNKLRNLNLNNTFILNINKLKESYSLTMLKQGVLESLTKTTLPRLPSMIFKAFKKNQYKNKVTETNYFSAFEYTIDGITLAELEHAKITKDQNQ